MILTRAQALKVSKRTFVVVAVPELDGEVRLASMSAGQAMALNSLTARKNKGEDVGRDLMIAMIQSALVDEQDFPLFDTDGAGEFLDRVSMETVNLIMASIPKPVPLAVPPGNSEPVPSVA